VAGQPNLGVNYLKQELSRYLSSENYHIWRRSHNVSANTSTPSLDLGDYTVTTMGLSAWSIGVIADDYGAVYLQGGAGRLGFGPSIARGDLLMLDRSRQMLDIDLHQLSADEKAVASANTIVGASGAIGFAYRFLGFGGSINLPLATGGALEGGITPQQGFAVVAAGTYTIQLWPVFRLE
jgi:hypothetical protein